MRVRLHHLSILLSLTLLSPTFSQEPTPQPIRRLLFAAELCRHGDRTPLDEFPADAFPASKWPEGVGQLTAVGMRAHYDLGSRLRARYVDTGFLPPSYNVRDVYIRSTDIDRTLMSAVSQMAGLFPPGSATNDDVRVRFGEDPLHDDEGGLPHRFQPVPVHTESRKFDQLLLPGNACPRHAFLMARKFDSEEFHRVQDVNADFLDTVARIVGKPALDLFDLDGVYDTWTVFKAHHVPLPPLATPDIYDTARNLSNWLLTFGNRGTDIHRLRAGLLLFELKQRMQAVALDQAGLLNDPDKKKLTHKFVLYSAHDTTVAATLAAMKVFDGQYPPYNSTVIWELFRDEAKTFTVRVEYNGEPLILPGCREVFCPIEEYIASIEDVMVPGEAARAVECLTGWRRYAAIVYYKFSRKGPEDLGTFVDNNQEDGASPAPSGFVLGIVLVLIFSVAGVGAVWTARARYRGYSRAGSDPKPILGFQDNFERREILM
eukprot:GFKZ01006070.1.p2 GENE.GFKZ01006070.1~~GFKZ01006070.1.p2  ORF type:complete len:488 (-),score=64.42 GFKZ01006070.1:1768-3231(-)